MPGGPLISLDGDESLIRKLAALPPIARTLALECTRESVEVVKNRMIEGIADPNKTGRVYTERYLTNTVTGNIFPAGPRPPHRASAPGEYPASDTGNLIRSIYAEVEDTLAGLSIEPLDVQLTYNIADLIAGENTINGIIGANADYAVHLEYKPPERGGRPFATRALEESRDDIYDIFVNGMTGGFSGGAGGAGGGGGSTPPRTPPRPPSRGPAGAGSNEGRAGFSAADLNAGELRRLLGLPPPPPPGGSSPP